MWLQFSAEDIECRFDVVAIAKQGNVVRRNQAALGQAREIDQALPELTPVEQDRNIDDLAGLHQREQFEQLIERAESAREEHGATRKFHQPELAHEKVVELIGVCVVRSEEHTSELQSLIRNSSAVFCMQ